MVGIVEKSVNFIPWWLRDHIRKIPIIAFLQRCFVKKYLSGKSFSYVISAGPAKGLKFPITLPDDKLIWTGTWEKQVAEQIYSNVIVGKPSLDVGSHRGFMAGIMALAGSSQVYCFEPNPENISHLEKLKDLNSNLPLKIIPCAVSEKSGEAEFSLMPESSMGKLSESIFQRDVERNELITVQVKSLDDLLKSGDIELPGFIKIDVEGAELLVLKGARKIIELSFPVFVVELHSLSLAHECKEFLKQYGYKVKIIQKAVDLSDESQFSVCHLLAIKK